MSVLTLYKGHTYIFDQSDSSNSGHPLRFSTTSDGTHGGGSEYTTGVTTSGTPGSAGAFTKLAVASDAPDTLYYYCTNHSGMGKNTTNKTSLQGGASGSSSPVTVSSLTNDETYNVRASAINAFGQSPYSNATTGSPVALQRGVFGGGHSGSAQVNIIEYIDLSSAGNATDFGDLTQISGVESGSGCSSATRGIFANGQSGNGNENNENVIQYITMASTGNATDFGDTTEWRVLSCGASNSTRGILYGGVQHQGATTNNIDYITIASTGNATDFGDSVWSTSSSAACSSTTRSVKLGGYYNGTYRNATEYITIASTGNGTDFGDLTASRRYMAGVNSSTRGVIGGGENDGGSEVNIIEYITIASDGDGTDFGDLSQTRGQNAASSSSTKGVFAGGYTGSATVNTIDQITIATTANATDFGDLTATRRELFVGVVNTQHGGLS